MSELNITDSIRISSNEFEWHAIRSSGAGGQKVNKTSTCIHLRFDIRASSLPEWLKERLLNANDHRVSHEGVFIIKVQSERTQERNYAAAISRLTEWIQAFTKIQKERRQTKPSRAAKAKRMDQKTHKGKIKQLRGKVDQ
ncbi:alternative ribosome rescue aminoacyl-tRNA hydrolase ArfB [Pleionea litopenaei]|uniref:Alternative ribosome rescue aminoacyl-tRNA hydrolase ArfB n=1 Tax=Pleionea litopenaei TaxID=3070815 RepID=A0AA51X8U2_9GAMM|nr:alternative ribosome rescue aminoacyl-tRNA hydrolase ArfB [Pleionea sp. HL-JVS1]WMS88465.1 alternative ribosome rescue aminoacyl-tRNA hydrolase ArfB [Pleionea sp. HL-JVS1]